IHLVKGAPQSSKYVELAGLPFVKSSMIAKIKGMVRGIVTNPSFFLRLQSSSSRKSGHSFARRVRIRSTCFLGRRAICSLQQIWAGDGSRPGELASPLTDVDPAN